jgi:hypothetical protein
MTAIEGAKLDDLLAIVASNPTPPSVDSAAILGDAAKVLFRRWLIYDHRATYDGCCRSHLDEATGAVAAAIRVAWKIAEEEAATIAAETLRQAYATEAGR